MNIEDHIEVTSAAHFLEKAADNSICVYYTDLNELKIISSLFFIHESFIDVFNEKAEETLPPHQSELNHHIKLLLKTSSLSESLYNLSKKELQILKKYIDNTFILSL